MKVTVEHLYVQGKCAEGLKLEEAREIRGALECMYHAYPPAEDPPKPQPMLQPTIPAKPPLPKPLS